MEVIHFGDELLIAEIVDIHSINTLSLLCNTLPPSFWH